MRGWLLDTNVISELRKPNCDPRVKAWSDGQTPASMYLSRVTIAVVWRRLVERGKAMRHTFPQPDLFIAATAILHDLCVATRNAGDFISTGVSVLNPWTDTQPRAVE